MKQTKDFDNTAETSEELLSHTEWEATTAADIMEWLNDEEIYYITHHNDEFGWE